MVRVLLIILSGFAGLVAFVSFQDAGTVLQQIFALLALILSAILLVGACVIDSVISVRNRLGEMAAGVKEMPDEVKRIPDDADVRDAELRRLASLRRASNQ